MVTISQDNSAIALINVFKVKPQNQQVLLEQVKTDADQLVKHFSGNILSLSCHKGLDGTTVATYVQFKNQAEFEAISKDPKLLAHQDRCAELAQSDAYLYEVYFVAESSV